MLNDSRNDVMTRGTTMLKDSRTTPLRSRERRQCRSKTARLSSLGGTSPPPQLWFAVRLRDLVPHTLQATLHPRQHVGRRALR